jgi:hypothetical protein
MGPRVTAALALAATLAAALPAAARDTAPAIFCRTYPASPVCQGRLPACRLCHETASAPVSWNAYGAALMGAVRGPFEAALPDALRRMERMDSDGDGATNLDEIIRGTEPGLAASQWSAPDDVPPPADAPWRVAVWDAEFALRRVHAAFCGASATYDELQALARAPDKRAAVHAALNGCLASTWWRDEGLARLIDAKVRPLGGASSCYGYYANFEQDYDLFSYVMTGGRDVRDLLRASYYAVRDAQGALTRFDGERLPAPASRGSMRTCRDHDGNPVRDASGALTPYSYVGGQALRPHERAGMVTTQWFLWYNTMGTYLPRQTAAQAYRAWLGYDIAQYEGLFATGGEPLDVDRKGVGDPACSACHSTLDPISYAFANYYGGAGNPALYVRAGFPVTYVGSYSPSRPVSFGPGRAWFERWRSMNPTPRLFGEPSGADSAQSPALVQWARRASDSDAFLRNVTEMLFTHAVGHPAGPEDHLDVQRLWRSLRSDGYAADRLLHRIVDTDSFGAP